MGAAESALSWCEFKNVTQNNQQPYPYAMPFIVRCIKYMVSYLVARLRVCIQPKWTEPNRTFRIHHGFRFIGQEFAHHEYSIW